MADEERVDAGVLERGGDQEKIRFPGGLRCDIVVHEMQDAAIHEDVAPAQQHGPRVGGPRQRRQWGHMVSF